LPISGEGLKRLAEKIVRGIVYIEHHVYIDASYDVTISFMENDDARPMYDMAMRNGGVLSREPGIVVTRAYLPEDKRVGIFVIEIWKRCRLYAAVTPKDLDERVLQESKALLQPTNRS
jgi:hypothetical protein